MSWSSRFTDALEAIQPYQFGQPVYLKPTDDCGPNFTTYVVIECERDFSGGWIVKFVEASNPTGAHYCMNADELTAEWPHKERYLGEGMTKTGVTLIAVAGGLA